MRKVRAHARAHRVRFVEELKQLVRVPTISGPGGRGADMARGALWLADHLRRVGLPSVRVVPTSGHPFVLAEWRRRPGRPTLLVYGHYDVVPAEETWRSPPFEPIVRGEHLYGRGASDDKGQLFAHLAAVESWLRATGELPLNLVLIVDGEEEVGSPGLLKWLKAHGRALQANVAVISDTPMLSVDGPALTSSLRGGLMLEVEAWRTGQGLHSGNFGGAIQNPLEALCAVMASLQAPDGGVAVPGFYDGVILPSPRSRAEMRRTGPDDTVFLRAAGEKQGRSEAGFTLYEQTTIRPALTVTGLAGGYHGAGTKAVIPTRATARVDVRLVGGQEPTRIARLVRRYLGAQMPAGLGSRVRVHTAIRAVEMDPAEPAVQAALEAYQAGFGVVPTVRRVGGSIPVASFLRHELGIPILLMGFALPDDRAHGPNERYHLPTFFKAIDAGCALLPALRGRLAESGAAGLSGPLPARYA